MPLYRSDHIEYNISSGHITINTDDGDRVSAYWAHPARGTKFPGIALVHNWWGMTDIVRRMAHLYAQMGYYVIAPDLFNGARPKTHQEAMECVKAMGEDGFEGIDAAISILETHYLCSHKNAAVGIGMGGSLAFESAIKRDDLEVAVAFYGFPHKYFGQFAQSNTPILAVYGDHDKIIRPTVIKKLKQELHASPLKSEHRIAMIPGAGHDFIRESRDEATRRYVGQAWQAAIDFIEQYIEPPKNPNKAQQAY
ncbi:MAG: dienelactone hydrolase family protein [Chloroflexota bacterium]